MGDLNCDVSKLTQILTLANCYHYMFLISITPSQDTVIYGSSNDCDDLADKVNSDL